MRLRSCKEKKQLTKLLNYPEGEKSYFGCCCNGYVSRRQYIRASKHGGINFEEVSRI